MVIEENISLKDFTTFRTGGEARYFCRVEKKEDLAEAISFAKENRIRFFILGGGSNILISDGKISALVIKIEIKGIEFEKSEEAIVAIAGAGEEWDTFVSDTVERGLIGLENLSLIPGTVGATPVQNVGAYGREVSDTILWVEVFDAEQDRFRILSNEACAFKYRGSIFKSDEGKNLILARVAFRLSRNGPLKTEYPDIQAFFLERGINDPTLRSVREAVVDIRKRKLPDVRKVATAGSYFKNPILTEEMAKKLTEKYPGLRQFPSTNGVKIGAGWMIENLCGMKGAREGNVGTHENQALVLVNFGGAKTEEILGFAKKISECIETKTGIRLESEVEYVS